MRGTDIPIKDVRRFAAGKASLTVSDICCSDSFRGSTESTSTYTSTKCSLASDDWCIPGAIGRGGTNST